MGGQNAGFTRSLQAAPGGRIPGLSGRVPGLDGRFLGLEGRFLGLEGRIPGLEGRTAALVAECAMSVPPMVHTAHKEKGMGTRDWSLETPSDRRTVSTMGRFGHQLRDGS